MDPGRPANGHQTTVNDAHIMGFCRGPRNFKQPRKNCIWGLRAGIRARPLVYGPSIITHLPRVVKYEFLFIIMNIMHCIFIQKNRTLCKCDCVCFFDYYVNRWRKSISAIKSIISNKLANFHFLPAFSISIFKS